MNASRHILTVTLLNDQVRDLLEGSFPNLWVEGEISNLAQPSSGHIYFTLKDAGAQIRAAMFRGSHRGLNFTPKNGQHVLLKARLSLYAPRGDYQLIVEHMEEAGLGALRRAYDELRLRLSQEGLFASERKRPLPAHIQHLAVITSPTGAAIRDILSVLKRRSPCTVVSVIPVPVQGKEAAPAIVRAISLANQQTQFDAILVTRGGGSLEDLWAFNEEIVARAIASSALPVVSGVGHETDFTIADFVADVRAPTPSAAAELLSQDSSNMAEQFARYETRLTQSLRKQMALLAQQLTHWRARLRHPGQRLTELMQRLDSLELRLRRAQQQQQARQQATINHLNARLLAQHPAQQLPALTQHVASMQQRLARAMQRCLRDYKTRLQFLSERAHLASPLAIVARGYSIIETDDTVIRSVNDVAIGQTIRTQLTDGKLIATVTAKESN